MATGDLALAAGMDIVPGTTLANTIDTELNKSRDYIVEFGGPSAGALTKFTPPPYAGAQVHSFDPLTGLYNAESPHLRQIRDLIAAGLAGQRVRGAMWGPSTMAGSPGVEEPAVGHNSLPAQVASALGARHGRVMASQYDSRWALGANIAGRTGLNTLGLSSSGAFDTTFTHNQPYSGGALNAYSQSATTITVTVDSGTPQALPLAGGSSFKALPITGLTYGMHALKIEGPSGVFIDSFEPDSTGLTISNHGRPSSSAGHWLPSGGTSAWSQIFGSTFAAFPGDANLPAPDFSIGQPMLNGSTTEQILELVQEVVDLGKPLLLVTSSGVGSPTSGTVAEQLTALYQAANDFNVPLLDLTYRVGWYAATQPLGLNFDTVHKNGAGLSLDAHALLQAIR